MTRFQRTSRTLLTLTALYGCAGDDKVDLGNDKIQGSGEKLTDYAGSWTGYAEGYLFEGTSDQLRIQMRSDGSGVLEVGEAAPLPAPVVDRSYPPGKNVVGKGGDFTRVEGLVAGFEYTIGEATVADSRLRFRLSQAELYAEWCALQTPVLDEESYFMEPGPHYACLPSRGYSWSEQGCFFPGSGPVDCGQLSCLTFCSCVADGCSASDYKAGVLLDATLEAEGRKLVGTLVLNDDRITVRMQRAD